MEDKNWKEISDKELLLGLKIYKLKKGELQLKYVKDISKQQKELQLKDKVIYNMAEFLSSLDIKEDICNNTGKDLSECNSINFGECEHCIAEYFINKTKEE